MFYRFIASLALVSPVHAATLDLELEHPSWATEAVIEFGSCVSGGRGPMKMGRVFDIRAVSAKTLRYSLVMPREELVCIRMSWHAEGVELLSPEIFAVVPR